MKKFEITNSSEKSNGLDIQVVILHGYLDSSTFPQLQDHLEGLIGSGRFRVIVDCNELNYISSAGIGVLMGMLQEVRAQSGDLKLVNMSPKIHNLFDMLGFSRLIRIYESMDEAKKAFSEEQNIGQEIPEPSSADENY